MPAAGCLHTVLLRSDGTAVACGDDGGGRCRIPALEGEVTYTQVAAGVYHTVLLRSDGTAVACGYDGDGRCRIPALEDAVTYTRSLSPARVCVVLQAAFETTAEATTMRLLSLSGEERAAMGVLPSERVSCVLARVGHAAAAACA